MSDLRQISAVVQFLRPEEGGRSTPVFSGYRPAFYFGDKQTDGAITLVGTEKASPGERCRVNIKLLHPERLDGVLEEGQSFEIKEGYRPVGLGRVTSARANEHEDFNSTDLPQEMNMADVARDVWRKYVEDEVDPEKVAPENDQAFYPNEDEGEDNYGANRREDRAWRDKSA